MNALSYLYSFEIECSRKDDEYAQNVAEFTRQLIRKINKNAVIADEYLPRIRDSIVKHGVYWGVNFRKIDKIAKWINSQK